MLNGFAVGYFWKHTDISDCFHLFNLMSVQVLSYHGTVTAEDVVKLKVHTLLSTEVHLQTEYIRRFPLVSACNARKYKWSKRSKTWGNENMFWQITYRYFNITLSLLNGVQSAITETTKKNILLKYDVCHIKSIK